MSDKLSLTDLDEFLGTLEEIELKPGETPVSTKRSQERRRKLSFFSSNNYLNKRQELIYRSASYNSYYDFTQNITSSKKSSINNFCNLPTVFSPKSSHKNNQMNSSNTHKNIINIQKENKNQSKSYTGSIPVNQINALNSNYFRNSSLLLMNKTLSMEVEGEIDHSKIKKDDDETQDQNVEVSFSEKNEKNDLLERVYRVEF